MNRAPYLSTMLDLEKPAEREAYDMIRSLIAHVHPAWKLLGVRREGAILHLAVEWARMGRAAPTYSTIEMRLDGGLVMTSTPAESAEAARAALDQPGARS
jgi:hypothetical protein